MGRTKSSRTTVKGGAQRRRKTTSPPEEVLTSSPKRRRGRPRRNQEAHHNSSTDLLSNISESPISQVETSEVDSSGTCRTTRASLARRRTKKQQSNIPPAKLRRGRRRKEEKEEEEEEETLQDHTTQTSPRCRPRFELKTSDSAEQDESLQSSDLSIELSHHDEQLPPLIFQEDEAESDEDEEDELPSFLMQADKKPPSITGGVFVWSKYRNFPFWPALVKSVNRKQKKASIIFIDSPVIHQKKGITVSLRTLKPFDCEDTDMLVCTAKENYSAAIEWSLELITDYRIRIACGSFSGSFIEYFAHDMSYPVRRQYPQDASERLTIASEEALTLLCDDQEEDGEEQEELSRSSKRLLPDRSHAAHNRANEKLVHFIVRQRMVERRLLAVIHGQQQSRWLRSFLSAPRTRVVNVYLEDDHQLDQVYWYLNELYGTAEATSPCLAEINSMRRVPFVLDVLLPEAIIYAIAGVDNVPVKKAEEKYLKGRCISNRERQEFDLMIEQQMRTRRRNSPRIFSDTIGVGD